jgi:hypothetical protein
MSAMKSDRSRPTRRISDDRWQGISFRDTGLSGSAAIDPLLPFAHNGSGRSIQPNCIGVGLSD